jgi:signal transduction histidine kinase
MARNSNLSEEEMIDRTDFDMRIRQEADRILADDLRILTTRKPIIDKAEKLTRIDTSNVWVLAFKFPWYVNGSLNGVCGVSVNITNRKMVENAIFNMTAMSLHEVLNKVNSIAMDIQCLQAGLHGPITEDVGAKLADILKTADWAGVVARDYLSKARIMESDGIISREDFDLRTDILDIVLEELSVEIKKYNITIDGSIELMPKGKIKIFGDKLYLKTVYRNLILNAIKHGGLDTTICFGFEERSSYWQLSVYNDGKVIPAELIPFLFKKYKGNKSPAGMGLALHSIKRMIESHGGQIWYAETESGHPNFLFMLPKF